LKVIEGTPKEIAAYELALKDGKKSDCHILINSSNTNELAKSLSVVINKELSRSCEPPVDTMKSAFHSAFQKANHDID